MKSKLRTLAMTMLIIAAAPVISSFRTHVIDVKDLKGAWEYGPADQRATMIITDNIFAVAVYDKEGKKFVNSYGGTWQLEGNKMVQKLEWNAKEPAQVGSVVHADIKLSGSKLTMPAGNQTWERIDKGDKGELTGAWIITGNYENDKAVKRPNAFGARRTMKVLSGTRFHWIAYNIETKEFVHAGGGTYTADKGQYTEHIDFFTKTPESVGRSIAFQYAFVDGDWRHKGQKSTGGPMDECWTKRETLEQ